MISFILRNIGALACTALLVFGTLTAQAQTPTQPQVNWQANVESAQRVAAQTNRLVLLHFWAPWCKPCLRLENEVFPQPQFGPALEANYVPVKLNADESQTIARAYGVTSLPVDVIITPTGKLVTILASPPNVEKYVARLNDTAAGYRQLNGRTGSYAQVPMAPPGASPASLTNAPYQPPPPGGTPPAATDDRYAEYNRAAQGAAAAGAAGGLAAQPAGAQAYAAQQATASYPTQPPAGNGYPPQQQPAAGVPGQPPAANGYPAQPPAAGGYNQYAQQPPANPAGPPPGNPSYGQGAAAPPYGQQPPGAQQPGVPPGAPAGQHAMQPYVPPVQLPPGSPPLGLDGYCPVTLVSQQRWVPGDKRWGAVHRDRTYLFVGPEEQKKFLANPDAFSPVISGNDPVLALDQRQTVPGSRRYGVFLGGRIYLFSSEASLSQFEKNPNRYAAEVLQAMR